MGESVPLIPLIPLSHLALDLPEPADGWTAELGRRGVAIVQDDLGRPAVSRAAARALLAERREHQEAAVRHRDQVEREAIQADRAFRAALAPGIPASAIPAGVAPARALMEAEQDAEGRGLLDAMLDGTGDTMIYHAVGEAS